VDTATAWAAVVVVDDAVVVVVAFGMVVVACTTRCLGHFSQRLEELVLAVKERTRTWIQGIAKEPSSGALAYEYSKRTQTFHVHVHAQVAVAVDGEHSIRRLVVVVVVVGAKVGPLAVPENADW